MDKRRHSGSRRLKISSARRHRQRPRIEVLENRQLLAGGGGGGGPTSVTWTGGGGDDMWSNPANWSDGQVPTAGQNVSIDQSGNPTIQITLGNAGGPLADK